MKKSISFIFASIIIFGSASEAFAAKSVKLKKSHLSKVKLGKASVQCGLIGAKWVAVKKSGSKYSVDTSSKAATKACGKLLAKGKLKSFASVPSVQGLAKSNRNSSAVSVHDVSGIPPTLTSIAGGEVDISTLFWRDGVVSSVAEGSATENQCREFYGGLGTDGTSGQFSACYISQNVGFSFQTILEGGISACYLKNAPTQANLDGGAVQVLSGSLPAGGVGSLFETPSGSTARLVKVQVAGLSDLGSENIFIKVYPQQDLDSGGDHYRVDLWQCLSNAATAHSIENMRIKLSGEVSNNSVRVEESGNSRYSLSAFLQSGSSGSIQFDPARTRQATIAFQSGAGNKFKSEVKIDGNDIITAKTYDNFGDNERKAVSIAHFSGSSMADFRYDQGAYKFSDGTRSENTVNEYREPNYLNAESAETADGTDLIELRDDISLSSGFFSNFDLGTFDVSGYDCAAAPDVTLALDMTNPLMQVVQLECEGERLEGMDFCRTNEAVTSAEQNFPNACPNVFQ